MKTFIKKSNKQPPVPKSIKVIIKRFNEIDKKTNRKNWKIKVKTLGKDINEFETNFDQNKDQRSSNKNLYKRFKNHRKQKSGLSERKFDAKVVDADAAKNVPSSEESSTDKLNIITDNTECFETDKQNIIIC
ncbi:hypothetical protein KGF54_002583 [Candida jiufengensis]|uniref:uncharacterized protein n=1 Tax=Candida jiufengensis TaxID=497108 RepID=UPI002224E677|nr:uncharacterized protein KGF54_002583 [Candida jiufengensis]KAI5953212.1 hypothetical protein KGF54_002583 [Candida jiufengensis]